jgi:hypothetical protein
MAEIARKIMTNAERAADVATGVSWLGLIASIAVEALPVFQLLAAIAAIVCSVFATRYYFRRTK